MPRLLMGSPPASEGAPTPIGTPQPPGAEGSTPSGRAAAPPGRAPPAARVRRSAAQQPAGDDEALHLAGALVDRGDAHVAVEARDLVLVREAVAAVDLQALPAGAVGGLAGVELGLRGE